MNKLEIKTLLNTHEIVHIKFTKKDGTTRDMNASLVHIPPIKPSPTFELSEVDLSSPLSEITKETLTNWQPPKIYTPEPDHLIRVVDTEKNEWRSIIIANIISATPV